MRVEIRKSRIKEVLDLDGASESQTQTSPLTDEETNQREVAQGHQLVSSGSASGIQSVVLKSTHLFLEVKFSITGANTLEARHLGLRPVSPHLLRLTWASHLLSTRFNFPLLKMVV